MNTLIRRTAVGLVAAGFALASTLPALANDSDVIKRGNCSGSANWKLKAKPDDGRIEVEGEVDTNRTGHKWNWQILHDGKVSVRGTSRTTARSGSFSVERRVVNAPGKDRIGWRAVNPANGQICRGTLLI